MELNSKKSDFQSANVGSASAVRLLMLGMVLWCWGNEFKMQGSASLWSVYLAAECVLSNAGTLGHSIRSLSEMEASATLEIEHGRYRKLVYDWH